MSSQATNFDNPAPPWWEVSLPPFAVAPSRRDFYRFVSALKQKPYGDRHSDGSLSQVHTLVGFALVVEALGLDKSNAGKFLRLFKLVPDTATFDGKVRQEDRPYIRDLNFILEHFEDQNRLERVRKALLPTKEQHLTIPQKDGYQLLQHLEDERSQQLRTFDAQEKTLLEQLKAVRLARDDFGRQLTELCPAWGELKRARNVNVTNVERSALVTRYESSDELRARFTQESYIATARANKVQGAEKGVYDSFRRFRDENTIRALVRRAAGLAGGGTPQSAPPRSPRAGDGVDDIAPE